MTDLNKLADFLYQLAVSCGVKITMRRCLHVLRNKRGISSEADILKRMKYLLAELKETPVYTVDGVQDKLWDGRVLYKFDGVVGHPHGLVEHTVSRALDYCSVGSVPVSHVQYTACILSGRTGCRCESYLRQDEYEQNFRSVAGSESLSDLQTVDLFRDLAILFLCDYLFFNPDRHYGNIIVLQGRETRRLAPIFDMGNSLLFVDEPKYEDFVPDPYGLRQLAWSMDILKVHPVFKVTEFYNRYDHSVEGYSRRLIDEYLERVLLCADSKAVQEFWEVV